MRTKLSATEKRRLQAHEHRFFMSKSQESFRQLFAARAKIKTSDAATLDFSRPTSRFLHRSIRVYVANVTQSCEIDNEGFCETEINARLAAL